MEQGSFFNRTRKFIEAYEAICKPYCQEIGISVQAFEILLAIARGNSSSNVTAQDICKKQNIKPTLMSFHIEKLVQAGLVERQEMDGNRRSIKLVCTPKALPVLKKGFELYQQYTALIWAGVSEEEATQLKTIFAKIYQNADKIINGQF